jgi:aminomuconate-semialdehyde/2-hydroxymuconate-6-semialdehyde dehydrogenase
MNLVKEIEQCHHFIGGEFVASSDGLTFDNFNPASGQLLSKVALGGKNEIDRAYEAAQHALKSSGWAHLAVGERASRLVRLADLIDEFGEQLAQLESLDTGKPISETLNGDVPRAARNFRFFAEFAKEQVESTVTDESGAQHYYKRMPLGVVGLITPWNLPLYLESWKIAPALVQGNAVILKPAELTPMTAIALAKLTLKAGIPPGIFNVVHGLGPGSAGEALVTHPAIKAISFTGETHTGTAIMRDAASHLKKLSFELGGKGATIILDDADLDEACAAASKAAFRNQGQICLAGSRIIVSRKIRDQVVQKLLDRIGEIKIGNPLDLTTTLGSLISEEHRNRVAGFVDSAPKESTEILCGGRIPKDYQGGAYYEPTLIEVKDPQCDLVQKEIFGPVVTLQCVDSDEQAIEFLNSTEYGLSCSIFGQNEQRVNAIAEAAEIGLVWINSWFLRDLSMPFGGMKRSGIGREGGTWSLDFYSELKTISQKIN